MSKTTQSPAAQSVIIDLPETPDGPKILLLKPTSQSASIHIHPVYSLSKYNITFKWRNPQQVAFPDCLTAEVLTMFDFPMEDVIGDWLIL